jgi:hypothetical protein
MVVLATIFLINNHYKRSSLNFKDNKIILKVKEKTISFDYVLVDSKPLIFSNINILQDQLKSLDGNSVYFETARAEDLYEFNQQTVSVVKTIFEAERIKVLCSINGLRAMQVILENKKIINLFVDDNEMKELKFFYGLPTHIFAHTIEKLQDLESKTLERTSALKLTEPMTKWGIKHHDMDGVIHSMDY